MVAMREDEDVNTSDNNINLSEDDEEKDFLDALDNDDDIASSMIGGLSPLDCKEFVSHRLPLNLHWDKEERRRLQQQQQQQTQQSGIEQERVVEDFRHAPLSTTAIMEEDEEGDKEDDYDDDQETARKQEGDDGLVNAWQYKLSIQQERLGLKQVTTSNNQPTNSGQSSVYCHSYDLSSNMKSKQQSFLQDKRIRIVNCAVNNYSHKGPQHNKKISSPIEAAIRFYRSILRHIQQELENTQPINGNHDVIRVFIPNAIVTILSVALPLLLSYIRQHDLPVIILITTRPWLLSPSSTGNINHLHLLHRSADAVLSCQSFASNTSTVPSEFSNLMGLLFVPKMSFLLPSFASTSATYLQANRFGLKRNRRKMEITMLHLPPEEFGSSSGGLRSTGTNNNNSDQTKSSHKKKTTGFAKGKKNNLLTGTTATKRDDAASLLEF